MKKIWHKITFLGLHENNGTDSVRSTMLANQLNFILIVLMASINILTTIIREINNVHLSVYFSKLLILLVICIVNFIFSYYKKHQVTKWSLIFLPSLIIVFYPVFFNVVLKVDFIYNPIIIISFSIIPLLLLKPDFRNVLFCASLFYFTVQMVFLDDILLNFSDNDTHFFQLNEEVRVYYKIVIISTFLFIQSILFYLRRLNIKFETELYEHNQELLMAIEELKVTQQHLIHAEKMASLGTLTAGVAHEINNPLNFISGGLFQFSEIRNDSLKTLSEETQKNIDEAVRMINEGFERVSHIVKALMTFSSKTSDIPINSNINELIENTLLFLKIGIPDNIKIEVTYNLEQMVPIYIDKFHQVIISIIENAIFALKETKNTNKKIQIQTQKIDDFAIIIIRNSGSKIPEEYINQLFDPFFTTKEPGVGTGVGLYMSYNIVKEHNGLINVQNDAFGVSFEIKFPLTSPKI